MPLSREQIVKALGDVDDAVIAELMGIDAGPKELAEAQAWLANDEPLVNTGRPLPSGSVSRLAEILSTVEEEKSADPVEIDPKGGR